jgi:hypothetical protein
VGQLLRGSGFCRLRLPPTHPRPPRLAWHRRRRHTRNHPGETTHAPLQDPKHRVVFEALTALPGRQPSALREQLPAQATRMGFPDVNWQNYFAAPADAPAIETLVAQLLATSRKPNL